MTMSNFLQFRQINNDKNNVVFSRIPLREIKTGSCQKTMYGLKTTKAGNYKKGREVNVPG